MNGICKNPVSGKHWTGFTWFTKAPDFKIIRYLLYTYEGSDIPLLVHFRDENNYEQFKDELDFFDSKGGIWKS